MSLIQRAWAIVKENQRAYAIINVAYYGLVAIFMVVLEVIFLAPLFR
jgi:hypothetical protein